MKNLLLVLGISISLLFSSCSIAARLLGIKDCTPKNKANLDTYFNKHHLNKQESYYLTKAAADSLTKIPWKPNWAPGFRPLSFKVFNKRGKMISDYSTCEGSINRRGILSTYPPKNLWAFDTVLIENDLKMYMPLHDVNEDKTNPDMTFVVYWASCLGKPSEHLIKKVEAYRKKYADMKIKVYYVNVWEYNQ